MAGIDDVGKVVEFLHAQEPLLDVGAPGEVHSGTGCASDEGIVAEPIARGPSSVLRASHDLAKTFRHYVRYSRHYA